MYEVVALCLAKAPALLIFEVHYYKSIYLSILYIYQYLCIYIYIYR